MYNTRIYFISNITACDLIMLKNISKLVTDKKTNAPCVEGFFFFFFFALFLFCFVFFVFVFTCLLLLAKVLSLSI